MAHYKKDYGSWEKALYAYHGGPGEKDDPGPAGIDYAKKILGKVGSLIGGSAEAAAKDTLTAVSPFDETEKLLKKFSDKAALTRVGMWSLGFALLLIGFFVVFWASGGGTVVKEAAGLNANPSS
jgi:hypothetical protein